MPEGRLWTYYADLEELADALERRDRIADARAIRDAVAGGSTSGEILSNTGVVLDGLEVRDMDDDLALVVRRLIAECRALWDGFP